MGKVFEIGIAETSGKKIIKIDSVNAVAGKGLVNDRFYKEDNIEKNQLTLIEKESIDIFNRSLDLPIPYLNFRRNIVTVGVKLNDLVGKIVSVGNVKIKVHDLCEPCKYLQDILNQNNLVKDLIHKSGLRSEILSSGKITKGDKINYK